METQSSLSLKAAVVLGGSLVFSAYLLSTSIKSYGHSVEKAAIQPAKMVIPSEFRLRFESGNSPVRIQQLE